MRHCKIDDVKYRVCGFETAYLFLLDNIVGKYGVICCGLEMSGSIILNILDFFSM